MPAEHNRQQTYLMFDKFRARKTTALTFAEQPLDTIHQRLFRPRNDEMHTPLRGSNHHRVVPRLPAPRDHDVLDFAAHQRRTAVTRADEDLGDP
jgi:hypothetical protein